jgi:hypothetical protein
VVLTQNDVRDYVVVRVSSKTAAKVVITYRLVTTDDFGATLVSGDPAKGGYDFSTKTYLGLSGGDLYFTEGAFWANNYDERGVADLGACATVDGVTAVPKTTYSRFGVTAVVGDCYVSPLHANNREDALFRVDSITATTVTLTWRLLPVPVDQLAWQHCEPYHNPSTVAPTTTAATLSTWLAQNPSITNAMQWIQPQAVTPPASVGFTSWSTDMQNSLLQNFVAYWAWYAGGMTGSDPTPVTDPPPNQFATSAGNISTVLAPSDAEALYVKYLALSFVVELQHQVPWSLLQFDAASLAELLDSRRFFTQYTTGGYELVTMSVVPAPPLMAAAFVAQHDLLCSNRPESIAETVFWARNLSHYENTSDPAQDELDYWQYAGNPPASRVLAGTTYSGTTSGVPANLSQWTMGCHGTTGLLKSLLRTINIPVEEFTGFNPTVSEPDNAFYFSGHAVPHFISEGLWLSHGDDPYIGTGYQLILPFPLEAMEIDDAQFFAWFPNTGPSSTTLPIGRQADELWIGYGDELMLYDRLTDLQTNPTPPDANICAYINGLPGPPNNYYSCAQAEAAGLLTMLDPLLQPYVASGSLSSDLAGVPFYAFPEAQFLAPPGNTCVPSVCAENASCCTSWDNQCQSLAYQLCSSACIY